MSIHHNVQGRPWSPGDKERVQVGGAQMMLSDVTSSFTVGVVEQREEEEPKGFLHKEEGVGGESRAWQAGGRRWSQRRKSELTQRSGGSGGTRRDHTVRFDYHSQSHVQARSTNSRHPDCGVQEQGLKAQLWRVRVSFRLCASSSLGSRCIRLPQEGLTTFSSWTCCPPGPTILPVYI